MQAGDEQCNNEGGDGDKQRKTQGGGRDGDE